MRAIIVAVTILVAGCASTRPTQTVNVPVPVSCVKPGSVPSSPVSVFESISDTSNRFEQVRALLIDRESAKGYEAKLEAIVHGCTR